MKRRWFQIHLSTAIVLMFVAGGFIGVNLQDREYPYLTWGTDSGPAKEIRIDSCPGWPWRIRSGTRLKGGKTRGKSGYTWYPLYVALDAAVALTLTALIGLALELVLRRRERSRLPAETK